MSVDKQLQSLNFLILALNLSGSSSLYTRNALVQRTKTDESTIIDRTVMNTTENVMFNVTSAEMIFLLIKQNQGKSRETEHYTNRKHTTAAKTITRLHVI